MAEKTPNPPVAHQDDQDLWLVSYSDDDDREMSALSIAAALSRGEIDANTIVWRDGMAEWKAIAEVDVLKEQLRQVTASPENQRKRATVIGGFGPAQPFRGSTPAAPTPATQLPLAAPAPGAFDDDEPTIVQQTVGYGSSPNNATPGPSRSRHPTSGNTLRIRTGGEPVTMRTPTPAPQFAASESDVAEPELESIPSALLITATNNTEVEEAVHAVKQRISTTPPLPTRGVMTRSSDPPHNKVSANLPRAALTRDGESDAPGPRITDAPKPPVPKRSLAEGADSLSPDDLKSESDSSAPDTSGPATPRYKTPLASVQIRDDVEQVYSNDLQKTRPPRSRREPLIESGTPPPIGELSEVASRIARSTQSQAPIAAPLPEPQSKSSSGRLIGWLLFGAAAVAGAFTLGKRSSDPTAEPSQPTVVLPTSGAGAPAANLDPSAGPGASVAVVSEAPAASSNASDSTYISLATKPSSPAAGNGAANKGVAPTPVRPTAVKPAAPVTPAVSAGAPATVNTGTGANTGAGTTPSAEPAAGGGPAPFDSSAAANALAFAANKASSCRQPGDPSGIARVTVTFTNSGKSTHALVDGPPFAGTATGGCIAATMRGTTVPAFSGDRVTVKKTVVIQ